MGNGYDWEFIRETIDMDEWKHSLHLPKDYELKRQACKEALHGKLTQRLFDIERIRKALAMLED